MSQLPQSDPPRDYELIPADQRPPIRTSTVSPTGRVEHEESHTADSAGIERHQRSVRDDTGLEHREESVLNRGTERLLLLTKLEQLIWLVFGCIEGLIAVRIVLRLIGANPQNGFAHLIYSVSAVFLDPFFTLTASPAAGRIVLEIPSLIAIAVYALLAWAIVRIVWLLFAPTRVRSTSTYDRYRT
jgi:YggT family protein